MILKAFGVSVIGPVHLLSHASNQDAFSVHGRKGGWTVAVCDGVGSCVHSDIGANAASKAVQAVLRENNMLHSGDVTNAHIHARWLQHIKPYAVHEVATTCLYSQVLPSGETIVGQLGDGLILYRENGVFHQLTLNRKGYGNQTAALWKQHTPEQWLNTRFTLQKPGDGVILMTDGISDDLIADALPAFFEVIYKTALHCSRRRAKRWLQKELSDWATPKHGDDKTLAAIFRG